MQPALLPAEQTRVRRILDEGIGDEAHWAFRAISHANAVAALTRLRSASVDAGVSAGLPKRRDDGPRFRQPPKLSGAPERPRQQIDSRCEDAFNRRR
jgi:hypothetical protein